MKERTKSKLKDIARDLISLYSRRRQEQGFQFSPDSYMQHELEASFIYEDTPDQLTATKAVKADMESPRPMDRLICGDVGFGKTEYRDGKFYRFDNILHVQKKEHFNASEDRHKTFVAIEQLKLRGYNTLCPDYPQPKWFYDMCDKAGMFVIDRANINSPTNSNFRSVGGTPANDPALVEEYLTRVKSMYYRSRNHSCVIGFALGGADSGNGYCMYKAYEWLKSVEKERPVFYEGAEGEWNTDL